jgi:hypothetical protein
MSEPLFRDLGLQSSLPSKQVLGASVAVLLSVVAAIAVIIHVIIAVAQYKHAGVVVGAMLLFGACLGVSSLALWKRGDKW